MSLEHPNYTEFKIKLTLDIRVGGERSGEGSGDGGGAGGGCWGGGPEWVRCKVVACLNYPDVSSSCSKWTFQINISDILP